ncbi:MAG: hypothetical protein AAF492_17955, partial [Verrucomicrobiota bacterium]
YYIQGQVGIVGHLYGTIDFKIITASVNVIAKIVATLVVESNRAIEIDVRAEVSVRVTVTLHIPFKVHIHLHFGTTIHTHFTIGSNSLGPWEAGGSSLSLTAAPLDPAPRLLPPVMNWSAPAPTPPATINLYFVPKFTLSSIDSDAGSTREVDGVALLLIDALTPDSPTPTEPPSFSVMAEQLMLWVFNAFLNPVSPIEDIYDVPLSFDDLTMLKNYFDRKDSDNLPEEPFTGADLDAFFANYTHLHFEEMPREAETATPFSPFPMPSFMQMNTPDGTVNFDHVTCDNTYFQELRNRFHNWS